MTLLVSNNSPDVSILARHKDLETRARTLSSSAAPASQLVSESRAVQTRFWACASQLGCTLESGELLKTTDE